MDSRFMPEDLVAEEIRVALVRKRISGRQLAAKLGWTSPYLSRRLTGSSSLSIADLYRIARALEVPVSSLLPADADSLCNLLQAA